MTELTINSASDPNKTEKVKQRNKKKRSLFCRCRQILLSLILVLIICIILGWLIFTNYFLIDLSEGILEEKLNMPVSIQSATLSVSGDLKIEGLAISFPEDAFQQNMRSGQISVPKHFCFAEHVDVNINMASAFYEREMVMDSIKINGLNVAMIELAGQRKYWLPKLKEEPPEDDPKPPPKVSITKARIGTGAWTLENGYIHKGDLALKLSANPTVDDQNKLSLNLNVDLPEKDQATKQLSLIGIFNGHNQSGYLHLENFELSDEIIGLLPDEIKQYIERHKIRTSLTDGKLARSADGNWNVAAKIEEIAVIQAGKLLKDLNLNLSSDLDWAANRDFKGISGEINLSKHTQKITLKGRIQDPDFGTNFHTSVIIRRKTEDFRSIDVAVQLTKGTITRKPAGIPAQIGKIFDDYKLFGDFDGLLKFTRKLSDEDVKRNDIYGFINLSNGTVTAKQFPYTLKQLTGRVDIANGVVYIKDFIGRGDSGNQVIGNGHFSLTEPRTAKMLIKANRLELDKALMRILDPGVIKRIDGLLGQRTMDAYNERLAGFKDLLADQSIKPLNQISFKQESTPDLEITVDYTPPEKPLDEHGNKIKGKWGIGFTIDITGSQGIYENFLYPIKVTSGKVHVRNNIITAKQLKFSGLSGGSGVLNGTFKPLNLSVETYGTPLDHHLFSALPTDIARQLAPLHLKGTGDSQGHITPEGYDFNVQINNTKGSPFGGKYPLEEIQADLNVTKTGSTINHLSAIHRPVKNKDTKEPPAVSWNLSAQFSPRRTTMAVQAQALDLASLAFDLIPDNLEIKRQIAIYQKQFQIAGKGDLKVDLTIDQINKKTDTRVMLSPKALSFDYRDHRQTWSDTSGEIEFESSGLKLNNLKFYSPGGEAQVNGTVNFQEANPSYDIDFKLPKPGWDRI